MSILIPFLSQLIEFTKGENESETSKSLIKKKYLKTPFIFIKEKSKIEKSGEIIYEVEDESDERVEDSKEIISNILLEMGIVPTTPKGAPTSKANREEEKLFSNILSKYKLEIDERKRILILIPDEKKLLIKDGQKIMKFIPQKEQRISKRATEENINCIICKRSGRSADPRELAKWIQWLVGPNKNIVFVRNWNEYNYRENISICEDCCKRLKIGYRYISPDDYRFKFITIKNSSIYVKLFPYICFNRKDDEINLKDIINQYEFESLDSTINKIIRRVRDRIGEFAIFFDLILYSKISNKIDILSYLEDIKLVDLRIIYDILEKCELKLYDNPTSDRNVFYWLLNSNNNSKFYINEVLILQRKLIKLERMSINEEFHIQQLINKKLKETLFKSDGNKIRRNIYNFLKFLNELNKKLIEERKTGILSNNSSLMLDIKI